MRTRIVMISVLALGLVGGCMFLGFFLGVTWERGYRARERADYPRQLKDILGGWDLQFDKAGEQERLVFEDNSVFISCDRRMKQPIRARGMFRLTDSGVESLPTLFADCPEKCGGTRLRTFKISEDRRQLIEDNGRVFTRVGRVPL